MGFLDNVIKAVSKVKEIADELTETPKDSASAPSSSASAPKPAAQPLQAGSCTLSMPQGVETVPHENVIYDTDENETDYVVTQKFQLDKNFHEFDSGAGEIDCSFAFAPNFSGDEDEYAEWNIGDPAIFIGFDQKHYNILDAYKKGKAMSGVKIFTVSGVAGVEYKTEWSDANTVYIAYHFKRGFDNKILYHIGAQCPKKYAGSDFEKMVLKAMDVIACTYSEDKKPE